MDSWISIAGSGASIIGALLAFYQAYRAGKSANKAERIRDEIVGRRKLLEVSHVHSDTKRILRVVARIGPACTRDKLKGVDCAVIAEEVDEYVTNLLQQSEHFAGELNNEAEGLAQGLRPEIEELAAATSLKSKHEIGKNIYYRVQEFLPIVKRLTDVKREGAPRV